MKKEERKTYIIAAIITAAIMATIPLSGMYDNYREKKLKTHGGHVSIVNRSDHRVAIHTFGHDSTGVVERDYRLEAGDLYVIRDSMSEAEVLAFPPKGFVDSAMLLFDDALPLRHGPVRRYGIYPWEADYRDHNMQDDSHWSYDPIPAGNTRNGRAPGRTLYRPARHYILTNEDYDRAVALAANGGNCEE